MHIFGVDRRVVPLNQQMEYNLLVPYTSNKTRNVELQRRAPSYGFGFSIRGGREHGTGFFVSHVEINSDAFFQGLKVGVTLTLPGRVSLTFCAFRSQVGDQIVRINGFSVEFAIHREVLQLIQSSTHLYLRVRSE
jgi:harmonin